MKYGFYSCMSGMPWGGSEVLWQRAARLLQRDGNQVAVNFKWWPSKSPALQHLENHGASLWLREKPTRPLLKRMFSSNGSKKNWLDVEQPDVVLVTLGYHPDQVQIADQCLQRGIPYAINIQCASNSFFIQGDRIDEYRRWYRNAEKVFFVSEENQWKVENNIAMKLDNAQIIANPFNVSYDADPSWPSTEQGFRIALVGRIHFQSKGHDIVVDVMRQPKWRKRAVKVVFYGHDQGNKRQLLELIKMHELEEQLEFIGFSDRVESIWEDSHALLLPSRYEGAPLVVIEAMLCNRIAITTDIGRNRELMDDNDSGFVALGATVELLDEAMERAWQKRQQWRDMGRLAGTHIRERYSADPVRDFAEELKKINGKVGLREEIG